MVEELKKRPTQKEISLPKLNLGENHTDDDNEIEKLKRFILFKLADIIWVENNQPKETRKTLLSLQKEIANYQNSYCIFPSNKSLEGRIERTLIRHRNR